MTTTLRLASALALGLGALAITSPLRADCCTPLPASRNAWETTTAWGGLPAWVGATEDGWVHVVVRDRGIAGLTTSSDAGQTFGFADPTITEGSTADGFAVAPDGSLLVGFQRDGELWFRRSDDHGSTWTPSVSLGPMAPATVSPHPPYVTILTRPNGLTALLAVTSTSSDQEHSVLVSPDFGRTWRPRISASSTYGVFARIALTDTTVAFAHEEANQVLVRRTSNGGLSWDPPVLASAQPLDASEWLQLISTGPSTFQVLYPADTATAELDLRVAVSLDDARTWDPANESVVGRASLGADQEPFAIATPSGGVVVGGWTDAAGAAGVASNFSSDRGLPGTWLAAPAMFATAGRSQHDFEVATLADDTVIVVHDDYRHDMTAECPGGTCESIYMSRSCPGSGAWDEFRIDEDTPPNPTHSEEPAIATTSAGRLHVAWLNVPTAGLGVIQLRSMAVQATVDIPVTLTLDPAPDCLSATQTLSLDSGLLTACASIAIQWYRDGIPVPGATNPTLLLDPADIDGLASWHATLACDAACSFRTLDVTPQPFDPSSPPRLARSETPAGTCIPAHVLLEAEPIPPAECGLPTYQWFMDGGAIPGARSLDLDVSVDRFPTGTHVFRLEARCNPARACGGSVWPDETVTLDAFTPASPGLTRTDLPESGCLPARTLLEIIPLPASECLSPTHQWFMDGVALAGQTGTSLLVSSRSVPVGPHSFFVMEVCSPTTSCGEASPTEIVDVQPLPFPIPANVGAGLRARQHGDPHAPDITMTLDWTLDEGQPRSGEHHHLLRGTSPTGLAHVTSLEPLTALNVAESTTAAPILPFVHYYSVVAANACEDLSLD